MNRLALLVVLVLPLAAAAQEKGRPMTVDDLFRIKRVSDPQVSPDGRWVVNTHGRAELDKNRVLYDL